MRCRAMHWRQMHWVQASQFLQKGRLIQVVARKGSTRTSAGSGSRGSEQGGQPRRGAFGSGGRSDRFGGRGGSRTTGAGTSDRGEGRTEDRRSDRVSDRTAGRDRGRGTSVRLRGSVERGRVSGRKPRPESVQEVSSPAEEFITGRRAVMEALRGDRPINKLLVQENSSGGGLGELLARARENGVVIQQVPKAKLDEVATNRSHQGVLAYVAAKPYVELEDLIARAKTSYPGLLVVLDGVEDPHNLGSILRSVDGVGAAGVIIPKRRAVPLTGTVSKASAGALEHVDVARVPNIVQALQRLKKEGFWIVGATGGAKQLYTEVDMTGNIVLVVGNEGAGLARLTEQTCDLLVKLPMHGQVNSLNAGVAAGILLYEVTRQRASRAAATSQTGHKE